MEVDNSSNAMGMRGCKVFGVYKSGELEPLRISHVEGEKIPVNERHEQVAFGIVFDTDDIIMKGIVHRCPLKMDGEFQFIEHN